MLPRLFNLIEGSLYRTPLRLAEAMKGEQKLSWDLGYHHGVRQHEADPSEADDQEAYMKGYWSGKDKGRGDLRDVDIHTDMDDPRDHLRTSDTYGLGSNIRAGLGMQPGDFPYIVQKSGLEPEAAAVFLAKHLQVHGQEFVDSDPEISPLWNASMATRESNGFQGFVDRQNAARAIVKKLSTLGKASIPEEQYARRKRGFTKTFVSRIETPEQAPLSGEALASASQSAGALFDALGPVAEATSNRIVGKTTLHPPNSDIRCAFDEQQGELTWMDTNDLFHEFGHAVDTMVHGTSTDEHGYWSARVQSKDQSPATNHGFDEESEEPEMVKGDHWATPYMGKVYTITSEWDHKERTESHSEVVPVFMQGLSDQDADGYWAKQIMKDPEAVLEVIGYMRSVVDGVREAGWGG